MTSSVTGSDLARSHKLLGLQAGLRFRHFAIRFRKYSPDQPRIPGGNPDGGQFTFGRGDAEPDKNARVRVAQYRARGGRGQWPEATPAQQARLAASDLEASSAMARVREVDGTWRPRPTIAEGIEGQIASNRDLARQASDRLSELGAKLQLPGPFAAESVSVRPGSGRPNNSEQRQINAIGNERGCHSCGRTEAGTSSGNFIGDHQHVTSLRGLVAQRYFPHCTACSSRQGGHARWLKER